MVSLENQVRKRAQRRNLQKIILHTVAGLGLLGFALVAPNALQALAKLGLIDMKHPYREKVLLHRTRDRLLKAGLLSRNKQGLLRLTTKGEIKLRHLELADFKFKKPARWDKKWRILVFDIKEERKTLREKIRRTLTAIGFRRLQDSVWVYPYDCENLIALLKADFKIGKDLTYIIADAIENDAYLRKEFGLLN